MTDRQHPPAAAAAVIRLTPRASIALVVPAPDSDTIECLEKLLKAARSGELIGLAFTGMLKRRGYIADTAGEADRNPTFTRGMLRALDDKLSRRVHGHIR